MRGREANALLANATWLAAARLLPRFVQIAYVIVLAREVGPELYGLFVYAQSWYLTLLPLTSFGLYVLLARTAATDRGALPALLADTLTFRIGVAGTAAVLAGASAYIGESDPLARTLLLIFSCALFGRAMVMWTEHVFVAVEAAAHSFRSELTFRLLESGLGTLLLLSGAGVIACAILHFVICWLQAAAALAVVHRRIAPLVLRPAWDKARELLALGWPFSLNVFSTGFLLQGPMVLYRSLAPTEAHIGQLAVALQAFAILCIVPGAAASSALPVLARIGRADVGTDLRVVRAMIKLGYGMGAVVGLVGLTAGPWVVQRVLGAQYVTAGTLVGPALWLVIPYTCGSVLTSLALVRGQIRVAVWCSLAGGLVLSAAGPVFTGWWEYGGMLVATGLALSCWVGLLVASGVGELSSCVIRPLGWVTLAFISYALVSYYSTIAALPVALLTLIASAPLFAIITRQEIRELSMPSRSGPVRDVQIS